MKRDLDLAREILIAIEDATFNGGPLKLTAPEQYSSEQVTYHIMLLHEAGLIRAFDFSSDEFPDWRPGYLTWEGHEFLNAAGESGRWKKAKTLVMEKGGGLVFEILKQVLLDQMKRHVFGTSTAS